MADTSLVEKLNKEINSEMTNEQVQKALIATTFKGFDVIKMKQAMLEGMLRGFTFKDFLEKNVYAISYGNAYSLITSIDYARKLGMRNGVVGKSAPKFEHDDQGKIISCEITIKRSGTNGHIGEYSALVYFIEYTTGKNLWTSKPHTMIAKVAEMHALRMACPEELSQAYVEEEMVKEIESETLPDNKIEEYKKALQSTKSVDELSKAWSKIPPQAKTELEGLKNELKAAYGNK